MSINNEVIKLQNSTATIQSNVNAKKPVLDAAAINAYTAKTQATAKAAEATGSVESIKSSARYAKLKAEQAEASAKVTDQVSQGIATALPKIKPTLNLDFVNNKAFDSRIDFTRSTTATYYDGKTVAKAEENLIPYSQDFTAWQNSYITVIPNVVTAPDGTTTASKIVPQSNNQWHRNYLNVATTPNLHHKFSFYCKAGELNVIYFEFYAVDGGTTVATGYFDTSTGLFGTVFNNIIKNATLIGDGWYRVELERGLGSGGYLTRVGIGAAPDGSFVGSVGDDVSGIYIWGAQLEQRDTLTAYTPTVGIPITNYIPVLKTAEINKPRIDYDPVSGKCKGFLMEESRTNWVRNSEQLSIADWDYNNWRWRLDLNTAIAPNGTLTAAKLVPTEASYMGLSGHCGISEFIVGSIYTLSGYYKYDNSYFTRVILGGVFGQESAVFDFETGEFISEQANVTNTKAEDVGNGWWRLAVSYVFQDTIGNGFPYIQAGCPRKLDNNWTPLDTAEYNGVYIWGLQVEQAPFASSYIHTNGSAVTRSIDSAVVTGVNLSDAFNNSEFSMYAEMQRTGSNSTSQEFAGIELSSNTFQRNVLSLAYDAGSFNRANARLFNVNKDMTVALSAVESTPNFEDGEEVTKFAFGLKQGDSRLYAQGLSNSIASSSLTTTPFTPEYLRIQPDNIRDTFSNFCGYCRKVSLYPKRLLDTELQALTQE